VDNVYDLKWNRDVTYREIHHRSEFEFSTYNFDQADVELLRESFRSYEQECHRLVGLKLPLPAYDFCLKCSHVFNILDARGAISVTERTSYIGRVRDMARLVAQEYLALREALGFPLLG
jgi:glycyl-tRNA synthetase alpha chain